MIYVDTCITHTSVVACSPQYIQGLAAVWYQVRQQTLFPLPAWYAILNFPVITLSAASVNCWLMSLGSQQSYSTSFYSLMSSRLSSPTRLQLNNVSL